MGVELLALPRKGNVAAHFRGLPKKGKSYRPGSFVTSRMSDNLNSRDRQNAVNGQQHPVQSGTDQFLSSVVCLKYHQSNEKRVLRRMFLSHSTVHCQRITRSCVHCSPASLGFFQSFLQNAPIFVASLARLNSRLASSSVCAVNFSSTVSFPLESLQISSYLSV